jgi:hypothetical protein
MVPQILTERAEERERQTDKEEVVSDGVTRERERERVCVVLTFLRTTGHLELFGHLTGAYSQSFS